MLLWLESLRGRHHSGLQLVVPDEVDQVILCGAAYPSSIQAIKNSKFEWTLANEGWQCSSSDSASPPPIAGPPGCEQAHEILPPQMWRKLQMSQPCTSCEGLPSYAWSHCSLPSKCCQTSGGSCCPTALGDHRCGQPPVESARPSRTHKPSSACDHSA